MVKRITVNYLVAAIITILVIMIELSVRSPILSPFLLIDDHKKEPVSQKIMAGFSSFQGNYLMNISSLKQGEEREPAFGFHLGSKSYTFYQLKDTPNLQIDKALLQASTLEVNTRKGVIAVFEEGAHSSFEGGQVFLNRYQITRENGSLPVRVTFESEFTREWVFGVYLFSLLFPGALFLCYRMVILSGRKMENLIIIFLPFLLAVLLPLLMNYYYVMSYLLLYTNSYLLSIYLSILLPIFLSLLITVQCSDYYAKAIKKEKETNEEAIKESSFFSLRKKREMVILTTVALLYVSLYFMFPLAWHSKIMNHVFLFIAWYLSLTFLLFMAFNVFHHYMGHYHKVEQSKSLQNIVEDIERKLNVRINLLLKQDSLEEMNAWIYSLNLSFTKRIRIYLTEGILKHFNAKEIKAILFHELGHVKLKHGKYIIGLSFLVAIAVSVLMFYTRQFMLAYGWWHYLLVFPVGVIGLVFLTEWLPKKVSKSFEHKADEYAVEQLEDKDLYINTLIKLMEYHDESDQAATKRKDWHDTHPSLQKRIDYIEKKFGQG